MQTGRISSPAEYPPEIENSGYTHEYLLSKIQSLGFNKFEDLIGKDVLSLVYSDKLTTREYHYLRKIMIEEYHYDISSRKKV